MQINPNRLNSRKLQVLRRRGTRLLFTPMEQWWENTSATDGIGENPARYRRNFNGSEWDCAMD